MKTFVRMVLISASCLWHTAAFALTDTVFSEGFSKCAYTSWVSAAGGKIDDQVPDGLFDNAGWTCFKAYQVPSAVKYGLSTTNGYLITPTLIRKGAGTVTVSCESAFYKTSDNTTNTLVVCVIGAAEKTANVEINPFSINSEDLSGYPVQTVFTNVPTRFKLKFTSSKKGRIYLDTVSVTEEIPDSAAQLEAPSGLELKGQPNPYELTLKWDAVDNAEYYFINCEINAGVNAAGVTNWMPLAGSPFKSESTNLCVKGLKPLTDCRFSAMAVGDGLNSISSGWGTHFVITTPADPEMPVFTVLPDNLVFTEGECVAFSISAKVNSTSVPVSYENGMPENSVNTFTFKNGEFSWLTAPGETGRYELVFRVAGSTRNYDRGVTFNVEPLSPPEITGLAGTNVSFNSFSVTWMATDAVSYVYDVWTGSSEPETATDMETFPEFFSDGFKDDVLPQIEGLAIKAKGCYLNNGFCEIKLGNSPDSQTVPDYVRTKVYPAAVTSLAFRVQGRKTAQDGSEFNVEASETGADHTWTNVFRLAGSEIPTTKESGYDKMLSFAVSDNMRVFRFEFVKESGNVGLAKISAGYAGAGARFLYGMSNTSASAVGFVVPRASPETLYFVRVKGVNAFSRDGAYKYVRFSTAVAPKMTIMFFK